MFRTFKAYTEERLALWENTLQEISLEHELRLGDNHTLLNSDRWTITSNKIDYDAEQLDSEAELLKNKITKAKNFLDAFKNKPQALTLSLANKILIILKNYSENYYVEDEIYVVIHNIDAIIQGILQFEPKQQFNNNILWRERYALLCGFVWQLMPENKIIFSFNDVLDDLINKIHLTNYEKVSNTTNDLSCKNKYLQFKKQHVDLFEVANATLNEYRISDFKHSINSLKTICEKNKTSDLSQPGLLLVSSIEAEVGKNLKRKSKRLPFYENILKTAKRTVKNPEENAEQISGFLPRAFNDNRLTNRIGAALLLFGGVTLITLSGLTLASTLGFGLAFAIPGLIFGSGLIIAGSYLATSSSVPTFKNPFAFFKQKNEKVYDAIKTFDNAESGLRKKLPS